MFFKYFTLFRMENTVVKRENINVNDKFIRKFENMVLCT